MNLKKYNSTLQRLELGSKLLLNALEKTHKAEYKSFQLDVSGDNCAKSFYQHHGMKVLTESRIIPLEQKRAHSHYRMKKNSLKKMIQSKCNKLRYLICFFIIFSCLASVFAYAEDKAINHFYFVQITDTHLGDKNHLKKAKKAVKQINRLPMDIQFVVHTGDITMDKLEDKKIIRDSLKVLNKLNAPVHYVPGNNDIIPARLESTTRAYIDNFGPLISMAEYQGVVCIFVYTEPLRKSFSINGYDPLEQTEKLLKESNGKPVILFHHAPCVSDFYKNTFHEKWDEKNKEKWTKLINSYNVKAVIAGHFHRDEYHWLGNVPLYVAPPMSGYFDRQPAYRIYEYTNGKIGYRTQYIE